MEKPYENNFLYNAFSFEDPYVKQQFNSAFIEGKNQIKIDFENTKSKEYLKKSFSNIELSKNSDELFEKICHSINRLNMTDQFQEVYATANKENDKILIKYLTKNRKAYDFNLFPFVSTNSKNLGIRPGISCSLTVKSLLERCETFKARWEHAVLNSSNKNEIKILTCFPFFIDFEKNIKSTFGLAKKRKILDRNLMESSGYLKLKFSHIYNKFSLRMRKKWLCNYFNFDECSQSYLDNYLHDNNEYGIKLRYVLFDTIHKGITHTGMLSKISLQYRLNNNYNDMIKFFFWNRIYFSYSPEMQSNRILSKMKYINVQNDFNIGYCLPVKLFNGFKNENVKESLLNDFDFVKEVRGFSSIGPKRINNINNNTLKGDLIPTNFQINNTTKINFYDYPILSSFNFIPFLFINLCFVPNEKLISNASINKNLIKGCFGLGLNYKIYQYNLEFLYSFGHFARDCDQIATFQINFFR